MAADPYRYFRVEARELLEQLSKGALDLERGAGAPDLVARLLRLTHTLKGAARVVKQREIADRAHAIEGALNPFRESAANVPRECIDLVLELVDGIGAGVAALALPADAGSKAIPGETFQTVRADIAEMDALLDGIGEVHGQMRALRRGLDSVERAHGLVDLLAGQRTLVQRAASGRSAAADMSHSVVDELRTIFGGFERNLGSALDQMDRELSQVRSVAEQLRLLPAGMLFTPLERAVRDTAQALGKRVKFEGRGGDVRLDAHVLGALQSALLQVVRNSAAHGVEPAEIRRKAGKPAEGRVTLEVARRGRQIVFRCSDDGMGVDLEGVRRAAQRKGLPAAQVRELDAGALLRLLLRGGISTSVAVTEESGRGIGLDLVREAVEQLGGEIDVRTEAGKTTTVELVVPLSIASLDAIVVESSGTASLIPLDGVRRTLRLNAGDIARTAQGDSVVHDGKVIPFAPLSRLLRQAGTARDNRAWSTVIVQGASGVAAFGVDRMLGAANIVFRPLPEIAHSAAVIAGASLDAEGNPQLVLDCDSLVAGAQRLEASGVEPVGRRAPLLIIDDSLTTRMLEQSILESAGFEVEVAASAEEGLEAARKRPHALFLVDVEMPGIDGFTFVERTRADPDLRGTPAIMVTSRDHPEDRQRAKDAGAQGYIVKGEFDQTDFLSQVRRLTA